MHELMLWKKREIDKLRKDIDQLFMRFHREFGLQHALLETAESFAMALSETENTLMVETEIPGIKPEDVQISVTEDTLIIKGETREETINKDGVYQQIGRSSRSFSRTLRLPCRILTEDVKASFKDNSLKITLPKCKPKGACRIMIETQ